MLETYSGKLLRADLHNFTEDTRGILERKRKKKNKSAVFIVDVYLPTKPVERYSTQITKNKQYNFNITD